MTADDVNKVMILLSEALADRGIRVEERRAIEAEFEEGLAALNDGPDPISGSTDG